MAKEIISRCPVCDNVLTVSKLTCKKCNIEITGEFQASRFAMMNKEELDFIESFIRVQGNIKEMEKIFKVSYPTIKKMLDSIILKMGGSLVNGLEVANNQGKDEILKLIEDKKISVEEAINMMKGR